MDSEVSTDIREMDVHRLAEGLHLAVENIRFGEELRDGLALGHQ